MMKPGWKVGRLAAGIREGDGNIYATGKDLLLVYLKNSKVKMNDDDAGSDEDL